MGMFDSLLVNCPNCRGEVEFQSKAGDCNLDVYNIHNVPAQIALDCKTDSEVCLTCGRQVKLLVQSIVVVNPYIAGLA